MKRLFWVALGATVGVLVVRKLRHTAEQFTPRGLASSLDGVGATLRAFADDVRAAMGERETELLDALGVTDIPPTQGTGRQDS